MTTQTAFNQGALERLLGSLNIEVKAYLEHRFDTAPQIVTRLYFYCDAIAPYFIPWMTMVWLKCKSDVARRACQDNLLCEITEDHPGLLHRYVAQAKDVDNQYQNAASAFLQHSMPTLKMISILAQTSPLNGLLVMAALENASTVFIPELRRWGETLGFTDFEYVDKHGMADIEHAEEFRRAVEAEAAELNISLDDPGCANALRLVQDLLSAIFSWPQRP